jgi:hypothetical protein
MAVTNLKRAAMDALAVAVAARLTTLGGATALAANCKAVDADWEEQASFPSLRVLCDDLRFSPTSMDEEVDSATDNVVVLSVGSLDGTAELRIGARTQAEREALEPLVSDLFLQTEGARGAFTISLGTITLPGGATAYQPRVTFHISDEDWIEEKVFDKRRYASLFLDVSLPVLVRRDVVGDMDTLILAFTQDLTTDADDVDTDAVVVDEDGNLSDV